MTATPGQVARRKFDHDEAVARFAAGETINALARGYGVAWAAVARVVDPKVRKKMQAHSEANIEALRIGCRGGCGRLVWMHMARATGYCPACLGAKRRADRGITHGTESEYAAGCRCGACLRAASAAKRRRREASRVPCSHGCGTLVDSINRRNPAKPPECRACVLERQRAAARERRAVAS